MSDIKISATHFAKGVGIVYMASRQQVKQVKQINMASRQQIKLIRPAVVKFTPIFVFFAEAPPTLLLPFSTTDAKSKFTCANQLRNWFVGCQVEVKNVLKCEFCR